MLRGMRRYLIFFTFLSLSLTTYGAQVAEESFIFKHTVEKPMDDVYPKVYEALENIKLYVVFEANIGENLKSFAEKWGENYNVNKLESIRSIVFCNGWYANAVSNADPDLLALCPMRLTLTQKDNKTTVLFVRPSMVAQTSPAKPVLTELENEIINAISTIKP